MSNVYISATTAGQIGITNNDMKNSSYSDGQLGLNRNELFGFGRKSSHDTMFNGGLFYGTNAGIVPHVSLFKMQFTDGRDAVFVYRNDPAGKPKTTLCEMFMKNGPDGFYEKVETFDELGLTIPSKNTFPADELSQTNGAIFEVISENSREIAQEFAQAGTIDKLINFITIRIDAEDENIPLKPIISVENINKDAIAVKTQEVFDGLSNTFKEMIRVKLEKAGMLKYYNMLVAKQYKDIQSEDLLVLDENNIWKLNSDYRNYEIADQLPLLADKKMINMIYSINESKIKSTSYEYINYTTVANIKDGAVLSVLVEPLRKTDKINGYTIQEVIKKRKMAQQNGELLSSNVDKLKVAILPKRDENGNFMEEKNSERKYQRLIAALATTKSIEEKIKQLSPYFEQNSEERLSEAEYSKKIQSARIEFYKDIKVQTVIEGFIKTEIKNFCAIFQDSDFLNSNIKYVLSSYVNTLEKKLKEAKTPEHYSSLVENIRAMVKSIVSAIKASQDNLSYVAKNNIEATSDGGRAPITSGRGANISAKDFSLIAQSARNKDAHIDVVFGFGATIHQADDFIEKENETYRFGTYPVPLFFVSSDKEMIVKTGASVTTVSDFAVKTQKLIASLLSASTKEEQGDELVNKLKKRIKYYLDDVKQGSSAVSNKVFGVTSISEFKSLVKDAETIQDLLNVMKQNSLISSALQIPDIAPLVDVKRSDVQNIKKALSGESFEDFNVKENDRYPSTQILSSFFAAKTLEAIPEREFFASGEEKDYSKYNKFLRYSEIAGNSLKKQNGETVFMGTISSNKDVAIAEAIFASAIVKVPLDRNIVKEIKEMYLNTSGEKSQEVARQNLKSMFEDIMATAKGYQGNKAETLLSNASSNKEQEALFANYDEVETVEAPEVETVEAPEVETVEAPEEEEVAPEEETVEAPEEEEVAPEEETVEAPEEETVSKTKSNKKNKSSTEEKQVKAKTVNGGLLNIFDIDSEEDVFPGVKIEEEAQSNTLELEDGESFSLFDQAFEPDDIEMLDSEIRITMDPDTMFENIDFDDEEEELNVLQEKERSETKIKR